jgi:hypothetical protein
LVLVVIFSAVLVGRANPPAKPDAKAIRAKLKGNWREFEATIPLGKLPTLAPGEGLEWWFLRPLAKGDPPARTYLTDWDNEAGQTVGELILNADMDPMWLDFKHSDAGREMVFLGIVRFEGNNLRWVRNWKGVPVAKWAEARGKLADRPKAFEDDKKTPLGFRLIRLEPEKKKLPRRRRTMSDYFREQASLPVRIFVPCRMAGGGSA